MNPFAESIIAVMQLKDYVPLPVGRIAERLGVKETELADFQGEVDDLVKNGTIVRLKKNRLCLPRDADLAVGTIHFRQGGSAVLIQEPRADGKPQTPLHIHAEDTWVAFHKDRVLVRLVRSRRRYRVKKGRDGKPQMTDEEATGRVIRILVRARESLTGTLQQSRTTWYVIPDDPRIIQDILVPPPEQSGLNPPPQIDDKVVVKLHEWKQRHLNPEGEIIKILGRTHTPFAEYKALLHLYNLEPEFPEEVMQEVAAYSPQVEASDRGERLDLRERHVFTIDPDDAKDFDDALSIERLPEGGWRVGIHIADVSHYVKPGTALDREARARGNSTYLVGTVIPMLPHALSNGLCSLVEAEDRLTKSVFITFSQRGKLIESATRFANSVIRSAKRLTYKQAFALLFDNNLEKVRNLPVPPKHQTGATGRALADLELRELRALQNDIRLLWALAERLRKRRMTKGSLDLDMPETKIFVNEEGYADRIELITHDASHQLIEEFMLAANEAVARTLMHATVPLIHRVHEKPDPDKLNELREYMVTVGIETGDLTKRKEIVELLKKIKAHPQGHVLRIQFLRSLRQANYSAEALGHYGLYKQFYTHFTSPIRRYSDLIVHRVFDAYLRKRGDTTATEGARFYSQAELSAVAQHLTLTEQNSTEAERESVKIKQLEFFEREAALPREQRKHFDAVIVDVRNHGMFVELSESLAYGMVSLSTLEDDLYVLNRQGNSMTGKGKRRRFSVGQKITVMAHRVDRFKRQIDFALCE